MQLRRRILHTLCAVLVCSDEAIQARKQNLLAARRIKLVDAVRSKNRFYVKNRFAIHFISEAGLQWYMV